MSKSIAFLSGKGGSGKTTLALTIATMLSTCKIKVLLVDCDLVTNGSTYFYEDRLETVSQILSFYDILYNPNQKDIFTCLPIEINNDYYFIPSLLKASDGKNFPIVSSEMVYDRFLSMFNEWNSEYDVILFDCSAGYTDVLKYIIPFSNINLVVLEADTVSMAAMRSLYLKVGSFLPDSKFYQVFNKIRPEIVSEYRRKDGSFFTNIGAISFDWHICDAFAVANVPTIDNAGIEFGNELNSICSTLFQGARFQDKLIRYGLTLSLRKAQIEQEKTHEQYIASRTEFNTQRRDRRVYYLLLMAAVLSVPFLYLLNDSLNVVPKYISTPFVFSAVIGLIIIEIKLLRDIKERQYMFKVFNRRIESLDDQIKSIKDQLAGFDSESTD